MSKRYINCDKMLKNGIILEETKEVSLTRSGQYFILDNKYKYDREAFSFLNIYKTLEEALKRSQKRNSEILKHHNITKDSKIPQICYRGKWRQDNIEILKIKGL